MASRPAPRVLVVDDHDDTRLLYMEYLEYEGFRVRGAADARTALSTARAEPPDIVITDLKMPGMDGFTLLEALKEDATLHRVPVVILTADVATEVRRRAAAIGKAEFVAKPCLPNELVAIVRRMIAST